MEEVNPTLQRFSEWLATPPEERVLKTQKDLAKELDVTEVQLSRWKTELKLYIAEPSEITALREHILDEAKKGGNAQMARLAWDIMNPKEEIKEAGFTADDYINVAIKTIEQLRESYRSGGGSCPVCSRPKTLPEEVCVHPDKDKPAEDN